MDMLYLYSDYLIFQNKYATATGLSDLVDGAFAHDKVTRFLRLEDFGSKSLWNYVKKPVRLQETAGGGLKSTTNQLNKMPVLLNHPLESSKHSAIIFMLL